MSRQVDHSDILWFRDEFEFLSNFFLTPVRYQGATYATVEHAFQAAKTDSQQERKQIRACASPGQAKRLGRKVQLRRDWEAVKLEIMAALLREKFSDPALRAQLLATGERRLIEGNSWNDTFWGQCRGHGKNHLGKLLMGLRAELRAEAGEGVRG